MSKTKANERVFTGHVIAWIKEQLKEGGLPFENAVNDSGLYGLPTVKFPDVLLTIDFEGLQPFCGWELKTPTTDVRDKDLLKDAVKKAQTIEAKHFVTWNMQSAIIWRTPEKMRAIVSEDDKKKEYPADSRITNVEDMLNREKAECLRERCREIVSDLGLLYDEEKINIPTADPTVFVGMVASASEKMASSLLDDINKARANREFNRRLSAWAAKQGVSKYDQDYLHSLSQQIAYKIIGKVLFYITLCRWNNNLPKMRLKGDNYKTAIKSMRALFQAALEVDYQAIFEADITDEIEISRDTAQAVINLTDNLTHWSFDQVPLDVVGNVLEKLVPEDARHSLGQYFTPERLADVILAFCVNKSDAKVMDPTCGTGTFLIRSYNRLRQLGMKRQLHHELLSQIWGFDIAGFPAELATINLYRQNLSDYQNFPRILSKDFFEVQPGAEFEFPPPKKSVKLGERIPVKIPKFDAIVGNFPFIRQELIEKANKGYKGQLERVLFDSWGKEYPALFNNGDNNGHKLALSGQADIYAYMFFHAAAHMKPGGRMGFITSNSWLDVAYGYELQKFFLSKFKLVAIFESRCEPWFEQSAINTVFTILERCDDRQERESNPVYFVKVKKKLEELFPQDALTGSQDRWNAIERFAEKIEELGDKWNAGIRDKFKRFEPIKADYIRQPEIISYEDDEVRVRIIKQNVLKEDIESSGQTVKWGQYLCGPDIYFEILEKCKEIFVPLNKVANLSRGITTGINDFFYLTEDQIKHWGIEKEFLKPIVTTTKEIPTTYVDEKKITQKIFLCDKEEKQLRGTNALRYIRWGESQKTQNKKNWPNVPSVQGRKHWYSIAEKSISDFLVLRFRDEKHYTPINPNNLPIGDTVFVGEFRKKTHSQFGCAFLNSSLIALFAEVLGRVNLGDGLLTTYGPEIEALPMPFKDTKKIIKKEMKRTLAVFNKLAERKVLPFSKEIKQKDRISFEVAVFKSIGLTEIEYQKVCEAVSMLIEERHLLPKLRTVKKKRRIEQDFSKLKEEVTEEILPSGVKRFPDAFVSASSKTEWEEIGIAAEKIKLGEAGMGIQEICDNEGNHLMELRSIEKAKYIVYAKQKDNQIVSVPKSGIIIRKAIKEYEIYTHGIKEELYKALMEKSGNHNLSENLTQQILEEFGLPDVR
jgi:type I restriction enzyme M protein